MTLSEVNVLCEAKVSEWKVCKSTLSEAIAIVTSRIAIVSEVIVIVTSRIAIVTSSIVTTVIVILSTLSSVSEATEAAVGVVELQTVVIVQQSGHLQENTLKHAHKKRLEFS